MEDLLISSLAAISWRRLTAGVRTSQCGGSPRVNSKLFELVEHVPTLIAWKPYPYEDYGK